MLSFETNLSVSHFASFSVSMKLGETFTYPGLGGGSVLLWECPCAVCVCPVALVGELDLK